MKLISALLSTALAGAGTDYSVQGKNWAGTCETGQRQSPIAIEGTTTVKEFSVNPFVLNNYSRDNEFDVTLDHSIKMTPTATDITFNGGYLNNEYTLAQFHLHWGDAFRGGSEHTLNGRRYFSEVHLVHYKTEYGGLNDDSLGNGDGLAVLGYFIDAGDYEESELDRVLQKAFALSGGTGKLTFDLNDMIDYTSEDFYRYEGSLTTPTCNEAVMWTVFNKPLTINLKTRDLMVETASTAAVNNNFRVPMPLNGRTVTYYHSEVESSAETTAASVFFATCAALALH